VIPRPIPGEEAPALSRSFRSRSPMLGQSELTSLATCSSTSHGLRTCFTPPPAPHLPTSPSTVTERPGPSAASAFADSCGAAITRRPGRPRAQRRSGQRSTCSKRGPSSTARNGPSTSARPSMPDTSTSISPMSTGAPSTSDLRNGG
jgi:hypothetical protein